MSTATPTPFSINETYSAVTANPLALTLSDPFPAARRSVGGVTSTSGQDSNIQSQYLQSWNLTVEHEFAKDIGVELAYAGSKGTHLQRRYDLNQQIRDLDYRAANGASALCGLLNHQYYCRRIQLFL